MAVMAVLFFVAYIVVPRRPPDTALSRSTRERVSTDDNGSPAVLFFVAYIVVARLFVMNLFVGFIVDGFNTNQGKSAVLPPLPKYHPSR